MIFKQPVQFVQHHTQSELLKVPNIDSDYEDDDLTNSPVQLVARDEVQTTFDEIISKICNKTLDLGSGRSRAEFLTQYGHFLDQMTRMNGESFLHVVASRMAHSTLIRYVVRKKRHLLHHKDTSDRTPLYVAIEYKNDAFVDAVLKEINDMDLDLLLRERCENGRNSIHAAIQHSLNKDCTLKLIRKASDITLSTSDNNGLTPLHLAVDYDRSSASQLDIVRALIARGGGAFDKYTTNPPDLSVYEYHNYTREKSHRRADGAKAVETSLLELRSGVIEDRKASVGKARRPFDELPVDQNAHRERQSRDKLEQKYFNTQQHNMEAPLRTVRRLEERTEMSQEQDIATYADNIRQEIKLCYLRSTFESAPGRYIRDQLAASKFLYGANIRNVNLSFDFSQGPLTISKDSFEESYSHMVFDETLRYVSFRPTLLQKPPGPAPGSRLAKKLAQTLKQDQGPNDLVFFFNWLHEKKVRHMLKVVVYDVEDAPHTDAAIEDCLRKFEIDTLAWYKSDLNPQTLFNACRGLKEIYLQWSGNMSILKAWGEPDGLPRLENLERVHLVWNAEETSEKSQQVISALEHLQIRLNQAVGEINAARRHGAVNGNQIQQRKPIVVDKLEIRASTYGRHANTVGPPNVLANIGKRRLQPNRWLECIDQFADEIQNVKVPLTDIPALKGDIKVAVVDDGVDIHIQSLQGKVIGGESFDRGSLDGYGTSPYYISGGGHGTMMADMVCRVCPTAKLFVYKLEMHSNPDGGPRQISAESAALAVMAAVRQKVDIISMSWTIRETEDNYNSISALRDAIRAALDANILLFGAASDKGAVTEIEYPCFYDRRIFRIGAATADGRVYDPTGNPQHLSFIFPGHSVAPRNPYLEKGLPIDSEEKSGSSISTALAAGLAALVLHCIRLGILQAEMEMRQTGRRSSTAVRLSDFEKAKEYYGMRSILRGLGLNEDNQKYLEVWKRLDGPAKRLRSPNGEMTPLEIIAGLARDLVSGIADH
ncbi:subtilisin-like protein [Aspergillus ibericus CBS 121593]|uniref:Subtilisin-like protein n=1 Tax=Aspergillus ibericus CBS 121593 TaxID=1448316 RepID=A0A395GYP5_9EURO|nr:subtilisin-like protein [Aspergillus ibericus CBS 121593]RAK99153.1 subtilisin-like protein [Aspergillus ibericus CBS 121593]